MHASPSPLPNPSPASGAGRAGPGSQWRTALLYAGPALTVTLLLLLLWGFLAWFVWIYPRELVAVQQRDLMVTSRAAAAQTATVLREAETATRMVVLWLGSQRRQQPQLQDEEIAQQLGEILQGTARGLVEVALVRHDGELIRSGRPPGQAPINLKDTEFFKELMQPPKSSVAAPSPLRVGLPLRLAPGGPQLLPLAMRLPKSAGDLDLVVALVSLQRFDALRAHFAQTPSAAIALLRADGIGLARTPALPGFVGRDLFADHPQRRRDFEAAEGMFTTTGAATDGIDRLGAYQAIPAFGLKLMVSVAEADTLAAHFRERRYLLMLVCAVSLSALATALALAWSQRRTLIYDAEMLAASDAAPMGLFRCDVAGRVTYANETYLQLHGLAREEQGWGWLGLIAEAERPAARDRWIARMLSDKPAQHVQRMRRGGDGATRLMSIRTAPLIVKGRVIGQSGTLEDITEREAQQRAQDTLTAIFDLTPDYVCQMDVDGRLIYLNPSARQRLGIASGDALGKAMFERYYTPERLARFRDEILPTARRDGHWHGRSGVLDPLSGLEVPVESTVLAHRNKQGQVETISVLLRDISAEVRARNEGRRFEAMLLAIAQTAPVMIAVLDTRQRYLFLNDALAQQMGVRREDWLGRHVAELLGDAEYGRCRPLIEAALHGEVRSSIQDSRAGGDGSGRGGPMIVELQYAPLLPEGGGIEGVICVSRDVTEARLEEQRLREASQTDPLTRLLNRAGFAQGCDKLVAQAREKGSPLCLLYMDLDRFKPVNDEHGHPVGDALLKAVAGRLRNALRPQDLVARLGGDEFAVLLPGIGRLADAEAVAAKLVRQIGLLFKVQQLMLNIGVSIGYCVAAGEAKAIEAMVALADARLYEAKRGGRGRSQGGMLGALEAAVQVIERG